MGSAGKEGSRGSEAGLWFCKAEARAWGVPSFPRAGPARRHHLDTTEGTEDVRLALQSSEGRLQRLLG